MAPVVDGLEAQYAGKVSVRRIDANREGDLANRFGISAVPTYVMLDATGGVLGRTVGGNPDWLADQFQKAAGQ
ncbi:MAG: thioredoxin family protein [Actinobacteria bacterium]|nr:thioredoxin family protein [Actinomycetota bacterium]MBU1944385.1 thioredoxin family protein [Actinomycetota bacterium]MBU2688836.1 thioredoxin family protein [Actinomycetota bacterium]